MNEGRTALDAIVYLLILGFAALQFAFHIRGEEFIDGETRYVELAQTIVEHRPYSFNSLAETRFPPGLPLILAAISPITGFSFGGMVGAMSLFTALGFVVVYEVLRREEGRLAAAVICLVLISTPEVFYLATTNIPTELPFLLSSLLVLLISRRLETSKKTWERITLGFCASLMLVASLMLRTAAAALLAGLLLWLAVSLVTEKRTALSRLKIFLPILMTGVFVQAAWTIRGKMLRVAEWPLDGWPGSYFSELFLKQGNYPELGNASLGDFFSTLGRNLTDYAASFSAAISRKDYIVHLWSSPAVILPLLLIAVAIASKILQRKGGFLEWYFLSYSAMYLAWPWNYEFRFLFPITPLACLYCWCGVKQLYRDVVRAPRRFAFASLPLWITLTFLSAAQGAKTGGLQPKLSLFFWLFLSVFATLSLIRGTSFHRHGSHLKEWLSKKTPLAKTFRIPSASAVAVMVSFPLIVMGLMMQIKIGRENLRFDRLKLADVRAARYVSLHTDKGAVIMARHPDILHYNSKRRVVRFPPISTPLVLMDGIRRHQVEFIVVIDRQFEDYFLPPERVCFEALLKAYPQSFRLTHHESRVSLYEVLRPVADFNPHG